MKMNYNQKVLDLFKDPKHSGGMDKPDGVGEVGNTHCGDVMKVMIRVKKKIVTEIKFQTYGCVAAIASSEALCRLIEGRNVDEAERLLNKDITNYLGGLPPIKMHCSVLGEQALKAAIADYKKKHLKK